MHISDKCVQLVKHFEGMHTEAYQCSAGVWTIGFGHTGSVDGVPVNTPLIEMRGF